MNLKVVHPPTGLTSPSITCQDSSPQLSISFAIQLQAGAFLRSRAHADSRTASRSSILFGLGSPSTSLVRAGTRAFWLPASRLTPAGKSAQIISRQYPRELSLLSIRPADSSASSITGSWLYLGLYAHCIVISRETQPTSH
jgi:hypothetical protein